MESTNAATRRISLPPAYEAQQGPRSPRYVEDPAQDTMNVRFWAQANEDELAVVLKDAAVTVENVQMLSTSFKQQSEWYMPRPLTPHPIHMRSVSARRAHPASTHCLDTYTDWRISPSRSYTSNIQPPISELKARLSQDLKQYLDDYPAQMEDSISIPSRRARRSGFTKSLRPPEYRPRRAGGVLFGPGGPAAEIVTTDTEHPNEWLRKGDIGIQDADPALKYEYLYRLSKALMLYGAPGHRIERYLTMTAQALRVEVQFFLLPDHMMMYIGDRKTQTHQARLVKGSSTDLDRWLDVHNVSKHVTRDGMTIEDAVYKLKEIEARPPLYGDWFLCVTYGLAVASIAPFAYGARFIDLPLCFLLGTSLGVLRLKLASRNHLFLILFEVSAAIVFSFLGRMFGSIKNTEGDTIFCYSAISQASISLLQPGYWITNACLELMNGQIATSGSRITYGLIFALMMAYGVAIGSSLYGLIDADASSGAMCERPISSFWNLLFVPFFSCQVAILGGANWRQLPAMTIISFSMYCVFFSTREFANGSFSFSASLGALTLGLIGNTYARMGHHVESTLSSLFTTTKSTADIESGLPSGAKFTRTGYTCAAAAMVPAMIVLVRGGRANRGLHLGGIIAADNIMRNGTAAGAPEVLGEVITASLPIFLNVIQIGLSIAVGLSVGALVVYPVGKSRSWIMSW